MDTSTFQWILAIVGLVILGSIFFMGSPEKRKKSRKPNHKRNQRIAKARKENPRTEPELSAAERREPTLDPTGSPGPSGDQVELPMDLDEPEQKPEPKEPIPEPEKVVLLYLQARDNNRIAGDELLAAALGAGLKFGQHDVFHREHEGTGKPIFSMANLTNPGSFDADAWNTFETKGITLFMTLPGPVNALDAWDSMLATARRLAEILHTDLLAEDRTAFTRTKEGETREDLRNYERSLLPEG